MVFMQLPLGYENFKEIIDHQLDFVDKTLFIQEILDDKATKVAVITRPRRFGKTLNLSMLHHFLAAEAYGQSTQGLFDGLKIAALGEEYMQHQGRYPVIFISFKDIKDHGHFEKALEKLAFLMMKVYEEHEYLLSSSRLSPEQKELFRTILRQEASQSALENALERLTFYLFQHHEVKPWLLIDEYDTPIQSSYLEGYYEPLVSCLRNLFGAALKTNSYLEKAVITGILRVAKESLFSGLNNLEVYTLTNSEYGQYFGFTEEEVEDLLQRAGLYQQAQSIRDWYNGYRVGTYTVYNPWSIVKCIRKKGELATYWVNTSDNQLIKTILLGSSENFRSQFGDLLQGNPIEKAINENMVYGELKNNEGAAWSLLLMAGYLKVISSWRVGAALHCQLKIPNEEVRSLYQQILEEWLSKGGDTEWFNTFLNHLLMGDLIAFERDLKELIEHTFSVHDTAKDQEVFYHGFMVGATASLCHNKNYEIKSNRESGYGRYDYMIFSHDKNKPTILIEIKRVPKDTLNNLDPSLREEALEQAAQQALNQMELQNYAAEARQRGRTHILKIGLAFSGKCFKLLSLTSA
jgi:hypothetical protein